MSQWCWISVFTMFGLIGGCAVSDTNPTGAQAEAYIIGEGQSCIVNDHCPRGLGCHNGVCKLLSVFGAPEPPYAPACASDGQCPPGRRCGVHTVTYDDLTADYCIAPTCSVEWSSNVLPPNSTTNFIVTSDEMPTGSYSLLYGTRNGIADVQGSYYGWVNGVFPITNFPGFAGFYTRRIEMYAPDGRKLCETDAAVLHAF